MEPVMNYPFEEVPVQAVRNLTDAVIAMGLEDIRMMYERERLRRMVRKNRRRTFISRKTRRRIRSRE